MKTEAIEQDKWSEDQEHCTNHTLPRGCDRISWACGQSRWLAGDKTEGVGGG
ncbi:MAG: hypothetical protein U9Q37_01545 [Euryarchaeota archaeon]|nr:hypothetical protein [Euryarchaeota archaeon]